MGKQLTLSKEPEKVYYKIYKLVKKLRHILIFET